jgi:hypothetical protein
VGLGLWQPVTGRVCERQVRMRRLRLQTLLGLLMT